jgi:putative hemolysin
MLAKALGPASVTVEVCQRWYSCLINLYLRATLTMKWEAAARPMTLLRRAMGKTSAPYNHVVLFSIPSIILC